MISFCILYEQLNFDFMLIFSLPNLSTSHLEAHHMVPDTRKPALSKCNQSLADIQVVMQNVGLDSAECLRQDGNIHHEQYNATGNSSHDTGCPTELLNTQSPKNIVLEKECDQNKNMKSLENQLYDGDVIGNQDVVRKSIKRPWEDDIYKKCTGRKRTRKNAHPKKSTEEDVMVEIDTEGNSLLVPVKESQNAENRCEPERSSRKARSPVKKMEGIDEEIMISCPVCNKFCVGGRNGFRSHYLQEHCRNEDVDKVSSFNCKYCHYVYYDFESHLHTTCIPTKCSFNGCNRIFQTRKAQNHHYYLCHSKIKERGMKESSEMKEMLQMVKKEPTDIQLEKEKEPYLVNVEYVLQGPAELNVLQESDYGQCEKGQEHCENTQATCRNYEEMAVNENQNLIVSSMISPTTAVDTVVKPACKLSTCVAGPISSLSQNACCQGKAKNPEEVLGNAEIEFDKQLRYPNDSVIRTEECTAKFNNNSLPQHNVRNFIKDSPDSPDNEENADDIDTDETESAKDMHDEEMNTRKQCEILSCGNYGRLLQDGLVLCKLCGHVCEGTMCGFREHFFSVHNKGENKVSLDVEIECPFCEINYYGIESFMHDSCKPVKCPLDGCGEILYTISCFSGHMKEKHGKDIEVKDFNFLRLLAEYLMRPAHRGISSSSDCIDDLAERENVTEQDQEGIREFEGTRCEIDNSDIDSMCFGVLREDGMVECNLCPARCFPNTWGYGEHFVVVHNHGEHKIDITELYCDFCEVTYYNIERFIHKNCTRFVCRELECESLISSQACFMKHMKERHPYRTVLYPMVTILEERQKCKNGHAENSEDSQEASVISDFDSFKPLTEDYGVLHSDGMVQCKLCPKLCYGTRQGFRSHFQLRHKDVESVQWYELEECRFCEHSYYKFEAFIHRDCGPLICPVSECYVVVTSLKKYSSHMCHTHPKRKGHSKYIFMNAVRDRFLQKKMKRSRGQQGLRLKINVRKKSVEQLEEKDTENKNKQIANKNNIEQNGDKRIADIPVPSKRPSSSVPREFLDYGLLRRDGKVCCNICAKICTASRKGFRRHVIYKHADEHDLNLDVEYECQYCEYSYYAFEAFIHEDCRETVCPVPDCSFLAKTKRAYNNHLNCRHNKCPGTKARIGLEKFQTDTESDMPGDLDETQGYSEAETDVEDESRPDGVPSAASVDDAVPAFAGPTKETEEFSGVAGVQKLSEELEEIDTMYTATMQVTMRRLSDKSKEQELVKAVLPSQYECPRFTEEYEANSETTRNSTENISLQSLGEIHHDTDISDPERTQSCLDERLETSTENTNVNRESSSQVAAEYTETDATSHGALPSRESDTRSLERTSEKSPKLQSWDKLKAILTPAKLQIKLKPLPVNNLTSSYKEAECDKEQTEECFRENGEVNNLSNIQIQTDGSSTDRWIKCPLCLMLCKNTNKGFRWHYLYSHGHTLTGKEETYPCAYCGLNFYDFEDFIHENCKPVECTVEGCDITPATRSEHKLHMNLHKKEANSKESENDKCMSKEIPSTKSSNTGRESQISKPSSPLSRASSSESAVYDNIFDRLSNIEISPSTETSSDNMPEGSLESDISNTLYQFEDELEIQPEGGATELSGSLLKDGRIQCGVCPKICSFAGVSFRKHYLALHNKGDHKVDLEKMSFCSYCEIHYYKFEAFIHVNCTGIKICDVEGCKKKLKTRKAHVQHMYHKHHAVRCDQCGEIVAKTEFTDHVMRHQYTGNHFGSPATICKNESMEFTPSTQGNLSQSSGSLCYEDNELQGLNGLTPKHLPLTESDTPRSTGRYKISHERRFGSQKSLKFTLKKKLVFKKSKPNTSFAATKNEDVKMHKETDTTLQKQLPFNMSKPESSLASNRNENNEPESKTKVTLEKDRFSDSKTMIKCTVCSKVFGSMYLLTSHMSVHSSCKKKYRCPVCYKSFSHNSGRSHHLRKHHPGTYLRKKPAK